MTAAVDAFAAERLAARAQLQRQGWITRHSEAFQHLPPPALEHWLGSADAPAAPSSSGWTLQPLDGDAAAYSPPIAGVARAWRRSTSPRQRASWCR